jgi:hypothetical protein
MIEVRPAGPGAMRVTFTHPCVADTVAVVGEFNAWNHRIHVMAPGGDGERTISVELPTGRRYRFRYLLEGERWENDWGADDYVANEFGGDDSVVDITAAGPHRSALGLDRDEERAEPQAPGPATPAPGRRRTPPSAPPPSARTTRARRRGRPTAAGDDA